MKKVLCILCVFLTAFSFSACGEILSESSKKDIVSVDTSQKSSPSVKNVESKNEAENKLSIDEQVIWEVDGVKIKATGIDEDSLFGTKVNLLVENNSSKDIGIGCDAVIVNDYMISDVTSITVTAGNKTNDSITLLSSGLKEAGIENIGKVELYLRTFDPSTYMTQKSSGCITLKLSGTEKTDTESNIKGTVLYDENKVKIVGKYVDESSFWGSSVLLYIENNSDKDIIVQSGDLAVNGFMVTSIMSQSVYAGKKAITTIDLLKSDLEANKITSIDKIETTFKILGTDFSRIATSDKVSFSVK